MKTERSKLLSLRRTFNQNDFHVRISICKNFCIGKWAFLQSPFYAFLKISHEHFLDLNNNEIQSHVYWRKKFNQVFLFMQHKRSRKFQKIYFFCQFYANLYKEMYTACLSSSMLCENDVLHSVSISFWHSHEFHLCSFICTIILMFMSIMIFICSFFYVLWTSY